VEILGYHVDDNIICCSDGRSIYVSPSDNHENYRKVWAFLVSGYALKVFWNLDYAVAKLLKILDVSSFKGELLSRNEKITVDDFELTYGKDKFFSMKQGKGSGRPFIAFSNTVIWHNQPVDELQHDKEYGINKAIIARNSALEVYNAMCKVGCKPTKLTSPVGIWEKDVLSKMDLPTIDYIPKEAGQFAESCYVGGWFEALCKGTFDATDYDQVGAYTRELANLVDLRQGKWNTSSDYNPMATYGFIKGELETNVPIHPFLHKIVLNGRNQTFTLKGKRETFMTLQAFDFMQKYQFGTMKIAKAWYWERNIAQNAIYPYQDMVAKLAKAKEEETGIGREAIKKILVGICGLQAQFNEDGYGKYYNPVYASVIETNTRLENMKFILEHPESNPLSITMDGIIMDAPVKTISDGWRLAHQGKCIIISTGVIGMTGKETQDTDFSLNYSKLRSILESNPEATEYTMEKLSFVSLGKAVENDRWADLGKIERAKRPLSVKHELKRDYSEAPKTGNDILTKRYFGLPWQASLAIKICSNRLTM